MTSLDAIEEMLTAGSSGLGYDATAGQYRYTWKTEKAWAGKCRQLTLVFIDGTEYSALFKFTK